MFFTSHINTTVQPGQPLNLINRSAGLLLLFALPAFLFGCSTTEDTSTGQPRQSRVEYMNRTGALENGAPLQRVPNLDEKASEINRKRNIEEFDHNGPATTPTELRTRDMNDQNTIVNDVISDTLRRLPPP